jgi:hypothetical protein
MFNSFKKKLGKVTFQYPRHPDQTKNIHVAWICDEFHYLYVPEHMRTFSDTLSWIDWIKVFYSATTSKKVFQDEDDDLIFTFLSD